jgi:hypothetical protein
MSLLLGTGFVTCIGNPTLMNDRLTRIEFFTLYELYLRKNEEFREAAQANRDPARIESLRSSLQDIFSSLSEKRRAISNHSDPSAH